MCFQLVKPRRSRLVHQHPPVSEKPRRRWRTGAVPFDSLLMAGLWVDGWVVDGWVDGSLWWWRCLSIVSCLSGCLFGSETSIQTAPKKIIPYRQTDTGALSEPRRWVRFSLFSHCNLSHFRSGGEWEEILYPPLPSPSSRLYEDRQLRRLNQSEQPIYSGIVSRPIRKKVQIRDFLRAVWQTFVSGPLFWPLLWGWGRGAWSLVGQIWAPRVARREWCSQQHLVCLTSSGAFISWVYKQAVIHQDEQENIMSDRKEYVAEDKPRRQSPQK